MSRPTTASNSGIAAASGYPRSLGAMWKTPMPVIALPGIRSFTLSGITAMAQAGLGAAPWPARAEYRYRPHGHRSCDFPGLDHSDPRP